MSVEQLAERLGETADRKAFLYKAGAASLGAVAASMGLAERASATHCGSNRCCSLCKPCGACYAASVWCWNCCWNGSHTHCCEGFKPGATCRRTCTGVICSWVEHPSGGCHTWEGCR